VEAPVAAAPGDVAVAVHDDCQDLVTNGGGGWQGVEGVRARGGEGEGGGGGVGGGK